MSEIINNREYRQKVLKELIGQLHGGKTVEEVKPRFEELIKGISTKEITELEQALIMEGMPVEEIQNLCDVHAAVFKGSIEEIHRDVKPEETPGHPIHTFNQENNRIKEFIDTEVLPGIEKWMETEDQDVLLKPLNRLLKLDLHYSRKENLLFPYLEKYNITAPPKVMWGVDDEIRNALKECVGMISKASTNRNTVVEKVKETIGRINEMIYKEEHILFPMALETLSEDEWIKIAEESDEIGYAFYKPEATWKVSKAGAIKTQPAAEQIGSEVRFDAGSMSSEEVNALLNTLPVDITFVGKEGTVKYFSQGKERIFARPKTVIGRTVANCHPPASVHIVEKIVEDFMSGKKDHEDFWIKMGDKFVLIRYFAVRNEKGEYLGTMECTQNIKPIQELTGEKRLMSE
ncbi:MAG TPA: PAS domain S-box protein [Clostridiales bacterium]|nr:PAS domain S-box protein [Clostridiales bacterium]